MVWPVAETTHSSAVGAAIGSALSAILAAFVKRVRMGMNKKQYHERIKKCQGMNCGKLCCNVNW